MGKKQEKERAEAMAEDEEEELPVHEDSDLCNTILERYKKSSAPQHRHLCASAAAMKAILQEENLPLTPPAYFAATISAFNDSGNLDANAIEALSSFLSILLPLVPEKSILPERAKDATEVLIELLQKQPGALSTGTIRSVVKSLGILMRFCDLGDWSAVKLPLKMILGFCVDKRPKIRRCAQEILGKIFSTFQCSVVIKKVSKVVETFFRSYMPLATEMSATRIRDGSKSEILSEHKHLEVLHMLNAMKMILPTLSEKVSNKLLSDLHKLLGCQFSPLTRHILNIFEVLFEFARPEVILSDVENIIVLLASYVSFGEDNPIDTLMSASTLLKRGLENLHAAEPSAWNKNLPLAFSSVAGLLRSEFNAAGQVAGILNDLINHADECDPVSIESICAVLEDMLCSCGGSPNEHSLAVVSNLFLKLGKSSNIFMKGILLKLSNLMTLVNEDVPAMKHLQECIGSAVIAMGPKKLLSLVPIYLNAERLTCSNIWLIPILKKYVVGASLKNFMESIVPLAQSIQSAIRGEKKSTRLKDLQASARGLWDLLPAFCNYPTDTYKIFDSMAKLLIVVLREDSFMHETIALALQELVNQNKGAAKAHQDANGCVNQSTAFVSNNYSTNPRSVPSHYSEKIASKNIKALTSSSMDLLEALADIFFTSPPKKRAHLKEAIGCLASITDSSNVKSFFLSSLKKFHLTDGVSESEILDAQHLKSASKEEDGKTNRKRVEKSRCCIVMELAWSLVEGADEDGVNVIFDYIRPFLQATDGAGQLEAYSTLSRIFMVHTWFYSARFTELIELLLGLKPPSEIISLRSRFICFHYLMIHVLKSDLGDIKAAFLILNEIISTLKDSREEARREAYDLLLMISCSLKSSGSNEPHQRLFNMIMAYLSGASPHIMSGAVAALSLLIYKDTGFCFSVPDLLPSILLLLKSKANEVIKAVLGFMKVLVSCLDPNDLQKVLSDIVNGVLPWSSVSKNHFRSKVRIIMEIVIRKCSFDSVKLLTPEKYRSFIKTVAEQRQSKTNSMASGRSDVEPKPTNSLKGYRKRTREEPDPTGDENCAQKSRATHKEKRRKHEGNFSSKNELSKISGNRSGSPWNKTRHSRSDSQGRQRGMEKNKKGGLNVKLSNGRKEIKTGCRKEYKRHGAVPLALAAASSKAHKFRGSGKT